MKNKVNILQVVAGMDRGGAETFLMNTLRTIDRDKFNFIFLCYGDKHYDYEDEINSLGAKIVRTADIKDVGVKKYIANIRSIILENDIHVVHAHTYYNSMFALIAAIKSGIKVRITHSHNTKSESTPNLKKRIYFKLSGAVINSLSTDLLACGLEAGRSLFNVKRKFTIIPNGININEFKFNKSRRTKVRKELSIENDTFIFLHAGRFEEQKNHEYLVDIFKDYHSDNPNSKLLLVGRGPLEGEVRNKVLDEGLEESVYFLGVRADMSSLYSAADIFLFPSLFEGLPVVLVEAQASSLACMVSERIDKSIDVTKLVKFIPIDSNTEIWVDSINRSRVEDLDRIQRDSMQAFNISETVKLLTSFYEVSND